MFIKLEKTYIIKISSKKIIEAHRIEAGEMYEDIIIHLNEFTFFLVIVLLLETQIVSKYGY